MAAIKTRSIETVQLILSAEYKDIKGINSSLSIKISGFNIKIVLIVI
jgi:hypothetical protein